MREFEKVLVFDMDGTIANLYGVNGWLESLRAYDSSPYEKAMPLYDMDMFNSILHIIKSKGWRIVVTSWLAKGSTPIYDKAVRKAKRDWLKKWGVPYDEIHLVKYGTPKHRVTKYPFQVLVDDNEKVRDAWKGRTIDANKNIIHELIKIVTDEF